MDADGIAVCNYQHSLVRHSHSSFIRLVTRTTVICVWFSDQNHGFRHLYKENKYINGTFFSLCSSSSFTFVTSCYFPISNQQPYKIEIFKSEDTAIFWLDRVNQYEMVRTWQGSSRTSWSFFLSVKDASSFLCLSVKGVPMYVNSKTKTDCTMRYYQAH